MKYVLFVVFFMPLLCAAQIFSHVWTGAANNQWNNAANWQPASVPSASSSVRIDTCANCPVVLAGNVQVADLYVFESGINLGEHTLKCGELSVYFSVFVSNNSLIDAAEILVFTENTVNGDIRFETNQGQFQGGNTFNNSDFPTPALRPSFSLMNKSNIKTTFNLTIPYWRDSLMKMLDL